MYIKDVIFIIKKNKNTKKEMKIVVIYKNFRVDLKLKDSHLKAPTKIYI